MVLEKNGTLLYINNKSKNRIDVIDREKKRLVASWPVTMGQSNTSVALDETNHRLFVGCRSGNMVVFDTLTGKELLNLAMTKGVDDMVFDPRSGRIYASCGDGQGSVDVFQRVDDNHYKALAKIASRPLAKTSLLSRDLNRYFVSAPSHGSANAAILVYEVH
jgi:DNA-binding beta-propeller fold protein YncE